MSKAKTTILAGVSFVLCAVFGLSANGYFVANVPIEQESYFNALGYSSALLACICLCVFVMSSYRMSSGKP